MGRASNRNWDSLYVLDVTTDDAEAGYAAKLGVGPERAIIPLDHTPLTSTSECIIGLGQNHIIIYTHWWDGGTKLKYLYVEDAKTHMARAFVRACG